MSKGKMIYLGAIALFLTGVIIFFLSARYIPSEKNVQSAAEVDYQVKTLSLNDTKSIEIFEDAGEHEMDIAVLTNADKTTKIAENYNVRFSLAYPNISKPKLIVLSEHAGGNCCDPAPILIDMSAADVFISESLGALSAIDMDLTKDTKTTYQLSGISTFPLNTLGDYGVLTLEYDREQKTLRYLPLESKADLGALIKTPASAIFKNSHQALFLNQLSAEELNKLRGFFGDGSPISLHHYRYLMADGIAANSSRIKGGRYVIDLITNNWLFVTLSGRMDNLSCYIFADNDDIQTALIAQMAETYKFSETTLNECAENYAKGRDDE